MDVLVFKMEQNTGNGSTIKTIIEHKNSLSIDKINEIVKMKLRLK